MSPQVIATALYGMLVYLIDGLTWGTTAYILFRLFGGQDNKWYVGASLLTIAYWLLDELPATLMVRTLDLEVGEPSIAQFLGNGLVQVEPTDLIWTIAVGFLGFLLGRRLVNAFIGLVAKQAGSVAGESGAA